MVFNYRIKVDPNKIQKDINKEIQKKINIRTNTIVTNLRRNLSAIIFKRLSEGVPTITGSDLFELGIPDINSRIISVLQAASNSFVIKTQTAGKNFLNISIGILKENYDDLLALPESVYVYTSSKSSGILEWLRWLLLQGGSPVVVDFRFSPSNRGRTGGGIMVPRGTWSVPANLQGTAQDNLLTRALMNIEKDIENIVKLELEGRIK